jgi:hypothetical protein
MSSINKEVELQLIALLTSAVGVDECLASRHDRFAPDAMVCDTN